MGFERGNVNVAMFAVDGDLAADEIIQKAGALAARALNFVKGDEIDVGWASGRCLLETELNAANGMKEDLIHLNFRKAQRKIPPALLKAACKRQELEYMRSLSTDKIPSGVRKEIKEDVIHRMINDMPAFFNNVEMVWDTKEKTVFAGATSNNLLDEFSAFFFKTFGLELTRINARGLHELSEFLTGRKFFSWLYRKCDLGECETLVIEGPFNLIDDGDDDAKGSSEVDAKGVMAARSMELKSAFQVGKKLRKARFVYCPDSRTRYEGVFDADKWTFGSLSLPVCDADEPGAIFAERIDMIAALFKEFKERFLCFMDSEESDEDIKNWLESKEGF